MFAVETADGHVSSFRHPQTLKPKNGKFIVALMAGGNESRTRDFRERLGARRGIFVKYFWDYERQTVFSRAIPADVDLVILIKSHISHSRSYQVDRACEKVNVPCVHTQLKWNVLENLLRNRFGLTKQPALPLAVLSTAVLREPEKAPPEPEITATPKLVDVTKNHQPAPVYTGLRPTEPVTVKIEHAHFHNHPSALSKVLALLSAAQQSLQEAGIKSAVVTLEGLHVDMKAQVQVQVPELAEIEPKQAPVKRATKGGTVDDAILASLQYDRDMRLAEIAEAVKVLLEKPDMTGERLSGNVSRLCKAGKILRSGSRHSFAYRLPPRIS